MIVNKDTHTHTHIISTANTIVPNIVLTSLQNNYDVMYGFAQPSPSSVTPGINNQAVSRCEIYMIIILTCCMVLSSHPSIIANLLHLIEERCKIDRSIIAGFMPVRYLANLNVA